MKSISLVKMAIAAGLLLTISLAQAEPTMAAVEQAAQTGHIAEADTMMREVIKAHPNSAKAHFVEAEILAKQNRLAEAKAELDNAERLQPGLGFAKAVAVEELKHKLGGSSYRAVSSGPNWLLWGGVVLAIFFVIMIIRSFVRPTQVISAIGGNPGYGPQGSVYPNAPYPNGPYQGGPYPGQGGGLGSTVMGGLATGAAVGAGLVAGEMLMNKVLDGNHPDHQNIPPQSYEPISNDNYDMGGSDFGINDTSSWDDSGSSDDNSSDWT